MSKDFEKSERKKALGCLVIGVIVAIGVVTGFLLHLKKDEQENLKGYNLEKVPSNMTRVHIIYDEDSIGNEIVPDSSLIGIDAENYGGYNVYQNKTGRDLVSYVLAYDERPDIHFSGVMITNLHKDGEYFVFNQSELSHKFEAPAASIRTKTSFETVSYLDFRDSLPSFVHIYEE